MPSLSTLSYAGVDLIVHYGVLGDSNLAKLQEAGVSIDVREPTKLDQNSYPPADVAVISVPAIKQTELQQMLTELLIKVSKYVVLLGTSRFLQDSPVPWPDAWEAAKAAAKELGIVVRPIMASYAGDGIMVAAVERS